MKIKNNIIFGGKFPNEFPTCSFSELLFERLMKGENSVALVDASTGATVTYNEILQKSITIANILDDLNVTRGSYISVFSENHTDFLIPVLGAMFRGIIPHPINFSYVKSELIHCLSITKPSVIFCAYNKLQNLLEVQAECPYLRKVIVFDENHQVKTNDFILSYTMIIQNGKNTAKDKFNVTKLSQTDCAIVFCSSGTTGLPKGVKLSHRNLLVTCLLNLSPYGLGIRRTDNILLFLPLFHAYGHLATLFALCANAKTVIMRKFEEDLFLQLIDQYQVTLTFVVPPVCVFLAKSDKVLNYKLTSIRRLICGAAPLSKEVEAEVLKRMKSISFVSQGYGMTEATLGFILTTTVVKPGSVGQVLPEQYVKVVDTETGKTLGPNQKGEIWFKGEMIMLGYVGNDEATKETIDADGWLHTGDIGYFDEDLCFFIVDRLKELIKYKGFQVAPAELEAVLIQNKHIKDAGVTGIPDEVAGELPIAFVVKQKDAKITEEDVFQFVKERLSRQKHLHGGVVFIDEIPKNPSGKILRRKLREIARNKCHL